GERMNGIALRTRGAVQRPSAASRDSVVVRLDFEVCDSEVDIRVPDTEIESESGRARGVSVVRGGDHFHAVNEALDDIPFNCCLDHVTVLDPILRTVEPFQ